MITIKIVRSGVMLRNKTHYVGLDWSCFHHPIKNTRIALKALRGNNPSFWQKLLDAIAWEANT